MAKLFPLKENRTKIGNIALIIVFFLVSASLINFTFLEIKKRFTVDPYIYIHDGAMQTEEAVKLILKGKNPYTENYFGTPLENRGGLAELNYFNPAMHHLVYLPFNILFSAPFLIAGESVLHWFDQRLVYIFIYSLFAAVILKWPGKSPGRKLIFLILFTINPWFFVFFTEGRNDIFVFFWIVLAVYFLERKKHGYSSLFLGLAAASKQSSWVLLPFYFAYLYCRQTEKILFWQKIKNIFKETYIFFLTGAIFFVPFLLWDFRSFIDDIIKYPGGSAYMSYPITGFGFSRLILQFGLVNSPNDYWPFWIPQVIFGLPLLYILLKLQKNNNSPGQMIFNYFLFLMTFWLFSRFFNDNYVGFLIMLFLFGVFMSEPRKKQIPAH